MTSQNLEDLAVVVAEDCDYVRHLLVEMLQSFGCHAVHEAGNGREVIAAFRYVTPDVVIADWAMAPVDGISLTRFVRCDRSSPNPFLPVIMVTADTSPARIFAARDAGVNELIAKPVAPNTLRDRICRVLWRPRPFVRTDGFFGPDRRRRVMTDPRAVERRGATPGGTVISVPAPGRGAGEARASGAPADRMRL